MPVEKVSHCGITAPRTGAVTGAEQLLVVKTAEEVKLVGF